MPVWISAALDFLFFCVLLFIVFDYVAIMIHELGHALGYMLFCKKTDWHITIGAGKTLWTTKKFTFKIVPRGGLCQVGSATRSQQIAVSASGPAASFLLMVVLLMLHLDFVLFHPAKHGFGYIPNFWNTQVWCALVGAICGVCNLIPRRTHSRFKEYDQLETDGKQIIRLLKEQKNAEKTIADLREALCPVTVNQDGTVNDTQCYPLSEYREVQFPFQQNDVPYSLTYSFDGTSPVYDEKDFSSELTVDGHLFRMYRVQSGLEGAATVGNASVLLRIGAEDAALVDMGHMRFVRSNVITGTPTPA